MDRDRSERVRAELEKVLGARYEILNLHGQGGMGMVFCARERALERLVAIKVLDPGVALTADARDRFRREARLAAALSHPSIVPLFDFGETGEFAYIVMAFVRGESLGRRLRHEGRLPPDVTRRILLDLSDALDHAHSRGIIHRDLKPENVLIAAETGRALLADFGIAKALRDGRHLTQSGVAIGTPEYMSPEQAAGKRDIDGRSDLYALGALGYTMLAGRPPHQGDGVADVMTKHLTEDPVPLREVVPSAPQDLVAAINRCLEKNPDRRWPDARAFHRAVAREASEDEPVAEDLRAVTGFGAFLAMVLLAAVAAGVYGWASNNTDVMVVAPLAGLAVGLGFMNYARGIAANGYALGEVVRVSMWPPKWWGLWWPPTLRRPGDVWDCLPTSARLTRFLLTLTFAAILASVVILPALPDDAREPVKWSVRAVSILTLLVVAAGLVRWRGIGLATQDASRLLFGPTVGATFWNQPHVAKVLLTRPDSAAACATPAPDTVRAMLHAIEGAAARLSGPAREVGSSAADAAQLLVNDIERLDAEIETLVRDANPEDLAELDKRLSKMSETQREARQHLEEYARLMRAQADLVDVKRLDREDANGTLRAIWTALEHLREHSGRGTPRESELIDRLRALAAAARRRAGH
jgi:predicted Ser/Thr protein kinase